MPLELRDGPLVVSLIGASRLHAPDTCYGDDIRFLLDRVWGPIRAQRVANKGINWVIYDRDSRVFAGVEPSGPVPETLGLEARTVRLGRHAAWNHIGPYDRIHESAKAMRAELAARGLRHQHPFIEIYGHHHDDPSKLETELLHALF